MGASQSNDNDNDNNNNNSRSIRRNSSMGDAMSTSRNADTTTAVQQQQELISPSSAPPKMAKVESVEEKMYRKFSKQPLVPIGCAATAYFLVSGIKSFQKRDPVRSQRMMRNRVMAQFVTILCFVGYVGLDQFDLRMAPMYQDKRKAQQQQQAEAAAGAGASTSPTGDKE